jgi:hypothetical protein
MPPSTSSELKMNALKVAAIGAEAVVVSTLAISSYHIAFSGTSSDWLAGAPIITVVALESMRLPLAFRLTRMKFMGKVCGVAMLAGLSVITGEAASIAFENLIFERTRPIVEAERDLVKATLDQRSLKTSADRLTEERARLTADRDAAQKHRQNIDKPPTLLPPPAALPYPTLLPPPTLEAIPPTILCNGKKGVKYICNKYKQDEARKRNADAQATTDKENADARARVDRENADARAANDKANGDALAAHNAELAKATAAVNDAQARLDAVPAAPDMSASDKDLKLAQQRVSDARAFNPMFRVAAAWKKIPAEDLSTQEFEQVKHWAVIGLAGATALAMSLAAVIATFAERGKGDGKLIRAIRAYYARKRKPIVSHVEVPVPGPTEYVDREVELTRFCGHP